jgi:4-aminobutyrate aminotransferase
MADVESGIGPMAADWLARDEVVISPSYTRSYPFVMARGAGSEVWDVDGRRYIDLTAGIAVTATGHCHPRVVRAVQEQAGRFLHMSGTDFYYPEQIRLGERLAALAPMDEPARVFFINSGAEAIEAALKLARWVTRRPRTLAFLGAFHGRTMGAISLSASKPVHSEGFSPLVPGVTHIPYPYCYRCPFHLTHPSCGLFCLRYVEREILGHLVPPTDVAAIFVEPIQGEGGYVVPPPDYLPALKALAERHGMLFVADEVQSGMGRTGRMFACEHWGVRPDIVTVAKGIASGLPLGAIIAPARLMQWPPGAHASTFGGNPLSCAAALVTLDLLGEGLLENARCLGERLRGRLEAMMPRHSSMGDIRGLGLMVGVELVRDRATREPAVDLRNAVVAEAFRRGLLLLGCGTSVVRFMPALNITADLLDEGLRGFEEALTAVE